MEEESVTFHNARYNVCYRSQRLEFTVLSLHRYFLAKRLAQQLRLSCDELRPSCRNAEVLCLPSVLLTDAKTCECHDVLLNPKYDSLLAEHRLKPGSVICVSSFVKRNWNVAQVEQFSYLEILDFVIEHDSDASWFATKDDLKTAVQRFDAEPHRIAGLKKLHFWFDMVPRWGLNTLQSTAMSATCNSNDLASLKLSANIQRLNEFCQRPPRTAEPLVVRVLCKTKVSHNIHPMNEGNCFQARSNLLVADNTGTCDLVFWNCANNEEFYSSTHIGSVILLRNYRVKLKKVPPRFPFSRKHPTRYDLELTVECNKYLRCCQNFPSYVQLLDNSTDDICSSFPIPEEQYNFLTKADTESLTDCEVVDVAGIVVGLSRFCRLKPTVPSPPGTAFVSRFVEVHDPVNRCFVLLDVFLNGQLECHEGLEIRDVVVLTFMRVQKCKLPSVNFTSVHLTTTQDTEVFVMKYGIPEVPKVWLYSQTVIMKWAVLMVASRWGKLNQQKWVGGLGCYPSTFLSEAKLKEVTTGCLHTDGDLVPQILQDLVLREYSVFGLDGTVAIVEHCVVEKIQVDGSFTKVSNTRERVFEVFRRNDCDVLLGSVTTYGSKHLHVHTLPVKGDSLVAGKMWQSLLFPTTTVLGTTVTLSNDSYDIKGGDLVCNKYFRILVVSESKRCAVWAIFIPPHSRAAQPTTLLDLLCLTYMMQDGTDNYTLHHSGLEFSSEELYQLGKSADGIMKKFTFVLQVYRSSAEETETTLSFAINRLDLN